MLFLFRFWNIYILHFLTLKILLIMSSAVCFIFITFKWTVLWSILIHITCELIDSSFTCQIQSSTLPKTRKRNRNDGLNPFEMCASFFFFLEINTRLWCPLRRSCTVTTINSASSAFAAVAVKDHCSTKSMSVFQRIMFEISLSAFHFLSFA